MLGVWRFFATDRQAQTHLGRRYGTVRVSVGRYVRSELENNRATGQFYIE